MNIKTGLYYPRLLVCTLFLSFFAMSTFAQTGCKISSKATCQAVVTVTYYRTTAIPNYDDVVVTVPAGTVVSSDAPSADPGWQVCSIYVDFGGGEFIEDFVGVGGAGCMGTYNSAGSGNCFTDNAPGSGWWNGHYTFAYF